MGAIFPDETRICTNCGRGRTAAGERECGLCLRLGDRSLVRIIRLFAEAETEAERAAIRGRFAAAKGRSAL